MPRLLPACKLEHVDLTGRQSKRCGRGQGANQAGQTQWGRAEVMQGDAGWDGRGEVMQGRPGEER